MNTMNNFIIIHPSLSQILSDCFQAPYHTHIFTIRMSYPPIFNDQFGLSTIKVQIYIPFIQYIYALINMYPFLLALRDSTDKFFCFGLTREIFIFVAKVGFSTPMPENKVFNKRMNIK